MFIKIDNALYNSNSISKIIYNESANTTILFFTDGESLTIDDPGKRQFSVLEADLMPNADLSSFM